MTKRLDVGECLRRLVVQMRNAKPEPPQAYPAELMEKMELVYSVDVTWTFVRRLDSPKS